MSAPPLTVPASHGDVLDRITILGVKAERLVAPAARVNVATELAALRAAWVGAGLGEPGEAPEHAALLAVNAALWEVEDALRDHEARGDFGAAFVALARRVYLLNDERARLKRAVNLRLGSPLREEKQHPTYPRPEPT